MKEFVLSVLSGVALNAITGVGAASFANASQSTTTPYPASCIDDFPYGAALYSGYSTDRIKQCQCETQLYSWYRAANPPPRTVSRTFGIGSTTQTITTGGSTTTTVVADLSTDIYTVTENLPYGRDFNWYGSAKPPCCSSCTIAAATVDVFYFPSTLPTGAPSSFVSNGYTFKSPSIYIGFTSLYAFDFCGNVGDVYTSTTIEFAPEEISTFGSNLYSTFTTTDTTTQTITNTLAGLKTQLNVNDLAQNCSDISGYTYLANNPSSLANIVYDPCHPTIVLPDRVKSVDPKWASCKENRIGGFYDPPFALTKAGVLLPPETTPPAPVQTAEPVHDPTGTAEPPKTTEPVSQGPPVSQPASSQVPQGPPASQPAASQVPPASEPVASQAPPASQPAPSQAPPASELAPQGSQPGSQQAPSASSGIPPANTEAPPNDPATQSGGLVATSEGSAPVSSIRGENSPVPSVDPQTIIPANGAVSTGGSVESSPVASSQDTGSMIMSFISPEQGSQASVGGGSAITPGVNEPASTLQTSTASGLGIDGSSSPSTGNEPVFTSGSSETEGLKTAGSSPSATTSGPAEVTTNAGRRLLLEDIVPVAIGVFCGFAVLL